MKSIALLFLSLLLWSGQSARSQQSQTSADKDALLAKYTKLLNYGSEIQRYNPTKSDAVHALGLLGDERAVAVLVGHLQYEEDDNLRREIAKVLGWIGSTNAVPALEGVLHDKDELMKEAAAYTLKDITGKDYESAATDLHDPPSKLKSLMRASTTTSESLLDKYTKLLNYGSQRQLYNPSKLDAVIALGLMGDEKAIPLLVEHLQNEETMELRIEITKALGWIGSTNSVPALEGALHDNDFFVRETAAMALKAITGKDYEYDKTDNNEVRMKLREKIRSALKRSENLTHDSNPTNLATPPLAPPR